MNKSEQLTWDTLSKLSIDDNGSALKFSDRLARENNWTKSFAKNAVEEYKKFVFLAKHAGHPVSPSAEVDEAWHLHMIYTRSYWDDMCASIDFKLHHGPTKGGNEESKKFVNWYEQTLVSYRKYFGEPPVSHWPSSEIRFAPTRVIKIDKRDFLVLRKQKFKSAIAACYALPLIILLITGMDIFIGALIIVAIWIVLALIAKYYRDKNDNNKGGGSGSSSSGCGSWFLFSCGSGCGSSSSSGCGSSSSSSSGCGSSSSSGCGSSCGGGCGGD